MALSSKALQKKRAKKTAKRKDVRKSLASSPQLGLAPDWLAASRAPIADVLSPVGLFDVGLGSIWFSRRLPDGRYAVSIFLLDTYCLGVKDAMFGIDSAEVYRANLEQFREASEEEFMDRDPSAVRKLLEDAVRFAKGLGFDPHPDYRYAAMIFGDVEASACKDEFSFGRDGVPFYVPGSKDSPAMQRKVRQRLEKIDMDPLGLVLAGS
ncbi:MAG: hypothetical protein H6R26_2082 [Proteobacteria bacterium]|nr:hypothetical protein [Pseudomonadota bacterium]